MEKPKRVVFIESDNSLREKYAAILEKNGFHVHQLCDGTAACACMKEARKTGIFPDLVIMAIIIPGMDGFDLMKEIKSHQACSKIPMIVFTDLDNDKDKSVAFSLGAKDYLVKDETSPDDLVKKAKEILAI